jgi:hypothetical protein
MVFPETGLAPDPAVGQPEFAHRAIERAERSEGWRYSIDCGGVSHGVSMFGVVRYAGGKNGLERPFDMGR